MARDRKRAKQRRQRRPAPVPGAPAEQEEGLTGPGATPAPDPLDHASAEVDQAHAAMASGSQPPEDEDAGEPGGSQELSADAGQDRALDSRRRRTGVLGFLGHSVDELRRVQWPDRRQVTQATAVVLGFVILAGSYLGLLDALLKPLVKGIL